MIALSPPVHPDDARAELVYQRFVAAARALGYTVEEDYVDFGRRSHCDLDAGRITIEVRLEVATQTRLLAHALGHALSCEAER